MKLIKIIWAVRAIYYKLKFKKIGYKSYIGKPIFLLGENKITIGSKVRIYPGLRMECHGVNGQIVIEDNVSIGQNLHIISNESLLCIGKNTTISGNVFITNMDHEYIKLNMSVMNQNISFRNTNIGENCFLGYGSVILAGSILGKQCIVGANSVVRGKYPDYCVIAGNPAKIIKIYNFKNQKWEEYP